MRKDFLVDPLQVAEARLAGAGGILIIVRMLTRAELDALIVAAQRLSLFVLIEAFDAADIAVAQDLVAAHGGGRAKLLIGVNSRDLTSLKVVPGRLEELVGLLPARYKPRVAESGVATPRGRRASRARRLRSRADRQCIDDHGGSGQPAGCADRRRTRSALMGFVKICGMKDTRAVEAALAAGADAIGFVFANSPRRVTPEQAAELARPPARGRALCVAVTQHPSPELLELIFELFRPDVLQTDSRDLSGIALPEGVAAWPVLRGWRRQEDTGALRPEQRLLFEGPRSGSGQVADWSAARSLVGQCQLILAGGLVPANVEQAIDDVHPFGVDVSSGVEEAPGRKSPVLIEEVRDPCACGFRACRHWRTLR